MSESDVEIIVNLTLGVVIIRDSSQLVSGQYETEPVEVELSISQLRIIAKALGVLEGK